MHEKEVEVLKNRFARVSDNTEANISFLLMLQPLRVTGIQSLLTMSPLNQTLRPGELRKLALNKKALYLKKFSFSGRYEMCREQYGEYAY